MADLPVINIPGVVSTTPATSATPAAGGGTLPAAAGAAAAAAGGAGGPGGPVIADPSSPEISEEQLKAYFDNNGASWEKIRSGEAALPKEVRVPTTEALKNLDPNSPIAQKFPVVDRMFGGIMFGDPNAAAAYRNAHDVLSQIVASGASDAPALDREKVLASAQRALGLFAQIAASKNLTVLPAKVPLDSNANVNTGSAADAAVGDATLGKSAMASSNTLRGNYDAFTALNNQLALLGSFFPDILSYKDADGNVIKYDSKNLVPRVSVRFPGEWGDEVGVSPDLQDAGAAAVMRANLGSGANSTVNTLNRILIDSDKFKILTPQLVGAVLSGSTTASPGASDYMRFLSALDANPDLRHAYQQAINDFNVSSLGVLNDISRGLGETDLLSLLAYAKLSNPDFFFGDADYMARLKESNPELYELYSLGEDVNLPVLPGGVYINLPFSKVDQFGRSPRGFYTKNPRVERGEFVRGGFALVPGLNKVNLDQNGQLAFYGQKPVSSEYFEQNPARLNEDMYNRLSAIVSDALAKNNPVFADLLRNPVYKQLSLNFGDNPAILNAPIDDQTR